jgi:hypothetical protein
VVNVTIAIYTLPLLFFAISCTVENDKKQSEIDGEITDQIREEYYKLGEAGFGQAYMAMGYAKDRSSVDKTKGDGRILNGLALSKDAPMANFYYARDILKFAVRLPRSSHAKVILLNEAERRVDIAIKNQLILDYAAQDILSEKYCGNTEVPDCPLKQKILDEANETQIGAYENLHKKIKAAQRGEDVTLTAPPLQPKS